MSPRSRSRRRAVAAALATTAAIAAAIALRAGAASGPADAVGPAPLSAMRWSSPVPATRRSMTLERAALVVDGPGLAAIAGDRTAPDEARNLALDRLRNADPAAFLALAPSIVEDRRDGPLFRSWAVQHLGLGWDSIPTASRDGVRALLKRAVLDEAEAPPVRRECLLALARNGDRGFIIGRLDDWLGDARHAGLQDLLVRICVELDLRSYGDRTARLAAAPGPAAAVARRALAGWNEGRDG